MVISADHVAGRPATRSLHSPHVVCWRRRGLVNGLRVCLERDRERRVFTSVGVAAIRTFTLWTRSVGVAPSPTVRFAAPHPPPLLRVKVAFGGDS